MALKIKVGEHFFIRSDRHNIILDKVTEVKKDNGTVELEWGKQNQYVKSVEVALQRVLDTTIRDSNASNLKELVQEITAVKLLIESVRRDIAEALSPLESLVYEEGRD